MKPNWQYMLGHQDGGKIRDCTKCGQVCLEYWLEVNSEEVKCSRCCNYEHPEIKRTEKKITCDKCGHEKIYLI